MTVPSCAVPAGSAGQRSTADEPVVRRSPARLALSIALLGALTWIVGPGTWAALSGTTENAGNTFSAGTVTMTDNDSGAAMFALADQAPGKPEHGCINVAYTGSADASAVRLYGTVSGDVAPFLTLTVTRGTDGDPSFGDCAGFVPDPTDHRGLGPGVLFSGTLASFPTTYDTGLPDPRSPWTDGSTASYRFTVELADDDAVQGLAAGAAFTWEARS